ncbi:hypothetical protein ACQJBY_023549 [Aegilops geniculata]
MIASFTEIFHLRCYRHELVMSCYHGENIARALPGLELCYSMTRRFLDKQTTVVGQVQPAAALPILDWKKLIGPSRCLGFGMVVRCLRSWL